MAIVNAEHGLEGPIESHIALHFDVLANGGRS